MCGNSYHIFVLAVMGRGSARWAPSWQDSAVVGCSTSDYGACLRATSTRSDWGRGGASCRDLVGHSMYRLVDQCYVHRYAWSVVVSCGVVVQMLSRVRWLCRCSSRVRWLYRCLSRVRWLYRCSAHHHPLGPYHGLQVGVLHLGGHMWCSTLVVQPGTKCGSLGLVNMRWT